MTPRQGLSTVSGSLKDLRKKVQRLLAKLALRLRVVHASRVAMERGSFLNRAVHCTVSKRYEIGHGCHDGCIGLRLVFSAGAP
jgi:hypothetical protein